MTIACLFSSRLISFRRVNASQPHGYVLPAGVADRESVAVSNADHLGINNLIWRLRNLSRNCWDDRCKKHQLLDSV